MRTKVTEHGVLIPKQMLEGVDEVEIRKERSAILLLPVGHADPIRELGQQPVTGNVDDASINHDRYCTVSEPRLS
ncbi:MAG: hypothetical protein H0V62_09470 [Gammaproteobacteria bacterium]|nr:hypothetical protein [Gammaproteobacteria bacterium]